MKTVRKLVLILLFIFALFTAFYAYLGGFHKLVAFEVVMWPHTVAYVDHIGDYKLIWEKMGDLYDVLIWEWISTDMGIGIYLDDPSVVEKTLLRSEGGVVVDKADVGKLKVDSIEYKIKKLEKTDYVVITFPFKNKLSYMVGMMRVYPVLWNYLVENKYAEGGPAIEMYDMTNSLIYYMVEVK